MDWRSIISAAGNNSFLGLLGIISYLASTYLTIPPGMNSISLAGAAGAMAGGGIAKKLGKALEAIPTVVVILVMLAVHVLSLTFYGNVADGGPGRFSAFYLYICTVGIFVPIGFLTSVGGVKLFGNSDEPDR